MAKNIQKCLSLFFLGAIAIFWLPQQSYAQTASASGMLKPLDAETIFSLVNSYRASIKLPSFEIHPYLCDLATSRAPQLYDEIFVSGPMHKGLYNRNLPYWITENMISMQTEKQALTWWLHSPMHKSAIEGSYTYSCVACTGNSCSEVFSNLTPKATPSAQLASKD